MNEKALKLIPFLVVAFIVTVEAGISFNSTLLPNIKAHFVVSDHMAQFTISGTLFALGFSGFIYGGLSDSLGRRPLFIFSAVLFSIGALVSATTSNLYIFLLARVLQGFGSGAGWVVGNACLKDIFHGKEYLKVMNYTHAVAGIVPAVAPVLGAYIASTLGWRNCFYILFSLSFLSAMGMYLFQPETLPQKTKPNAIKILKDYQSVLMNGIFLKYLCIKVLMVMLLFCEISTLPLVFVDYLQVNPKYYGLYILPVFGAYALASVYANKLVHHRPVEYVLKLGAFSILASNVTLMAGHLFAISPVQIMIIKSFTYIGWGFIFGNATSKIVSIIPGKAGMAAALMIALEMLFSGIGISIVGVFFNGTLLPLSLYMCLITAIVLMVLFSIKPPPIAAESYE